MAELNEEEPVRVEVPPELPEEQQKELVNETPEFMMEGFNLVTSFIISYGWHILLAAAILLYLRRRFQPQITQWQERRSDKEYHQKYDAETTIKRQEARQRSLMKMQELNDIKASELLLKEKEKEEQKRKAQIEDWENHKQGKGYRSKQYKPTDENTTKGEVKKPKPKTTFRPNDYNPLMGNSSGGSGARRQTRSSRGG